MNKSRCFIIFAFLLIIAIFLMTKPTNVLASKLVDTSGKTNFYGVFIGSDQNDFENIKKVADALQNWPGWKDHISVIQGGKTSKDATKAKITDAINKYKTQAKPGDEFIFWYLGHGSGGAIVDGGDKKIDTPLADGDIIITNKDDGSKHISPGTDGLFLSGPPKGNDEDAGRIDGQKDGDEETKADPDDEPKKGDKVQVGTDENGDPIYEELTGDDRFDDVIVVDFDGKTNVITDDELTDMLSGFHFSVTMVVILDSCFAASFIDGKADLPSITQKLREHEEVKDVPACSVQFIGAAAFANAMAELTAHINAFEVFKKDTTTKADANNDGITTLRELYDEFKTGTYSEWWVPYDNDQDGKIDEDSETHIEEKESPLIIYHLAYDDDGDGLLDEDPAPIRYVYFETSYAKPAITGYNTYWLIFIAISLMLAGGYLILKQRRKFFQIK